MAKKTSAASKNRPKKKRAAAPAAGRAPAAAMPKMPSFEDMSKMTKMMTPQQAIDLYKANSRIALDSTYAMPAVESGRMVACTYPMSEVSVKRMTQFNHCSEPSAERRDSSFWKRAHNHSSDAGGSFSNA